jgi:epoxyqueuosine reductase
LPDFDERQGLSGQQLIALWRWSETDFLRFTEGSAIRRIGHERWLRNIALAMGNALRSLALQVTDEAVQTTINNLRQALQQQAAHASEVVRDQVAWSLAQ